MNCFGGEVRGAERERERERERETLQEKGQISTLI